MLGIITIAVGKRRYIEMSKMLAISLLMTNPGIKRAVISDAAETEFDGLYDLYIPYDAGFGKGLRQKLFLDKYSPFEETLFIDADCLVFKSLDGIIELCRRHSFVVFGDQINSGEWYMDVAEMCKKFSLKSIPLFNGGTYYFSNGPVVTNIYNTARQLAKNYTANGFEAFRGSINEEPLIAIAMAINGVEAVDDQAKGMRTPIGINGGLKIDVLKGVCSFNKEGEHAQPAIMHFSGSYSLAFHYKREVTKLKLTNTFPSLNRRLCSFMVNLLYDIPYSLFVFCKRVAKTIFRGEKFEFGNSLPVYSNQ